MTCDTLGTICYELSIKKGKKDTPFRNSCYPACKRIKYSLEEAKKSRLDSYSQTKDIIGEDFYNYLPGTNVGNNSTPVNTFVIGEAFPVHPDPVRD